MYSFKTLLIAASASSALLLTAAPASAQLEEIVVTARRVESNLQDTPISVAAFTARDLELRGIEAGRDLGIMVPNVVINGGGVGERDAIMIIRGMPGVGVYVDGVWQGDVGVLQTHFTEMERVEVLRGPQGTLFGRNTNGGAIQMITRRPADEFGARVGLTTGEFSRRDLTAAVDLPISDTLKTKFMAASLQNDGFLQSLSVPRSFGNQDDELFRADVLWTPTDNFQLRFTANDEAKESSDARIVRMTRADGGELHARFIALNLVAGNPDFLNGTPAMDFGVPVNAYTSITHETNFPGGQLGKWQTRSDMETAGLIVDSQYYTLTMNWDITDNISLESISSRTEFDSKQLTDFDAGEVTTTTDDRRNFDRGFTQEFHLTGSNFDGRVTWLAGYYLLDRELKFRHQRWAMYDFAIPAPGPGNPGMNIAMRDFVRAWGVANDAPNCVTSCVATFTPLTFGALDELTVDEDKDTALFGEVNIALTDQLDLTLGVRVTDDEGREFVLTPTTGFRNIIPGGEPVGDSFTGTFASVEEDPDLGTVTTGKFALQYQWTEDIMVYGSWSEGFTKGDINNDPNFGIIIIDPEIVENLEFGLRSDWLDGRLRFNATYFDMDWDGLRVPILPPDPNNPGQFLPEPVDTSEGLAKASGAELELSYVPNERWMFNAALGVLDSEYLEAGDPASSSVRVGNPFQYAPDLSYSLGIQHNLTLANGGQMLFRGDYGWMDEYQRDAADQRQIKDANGNNQSEPSYGLLNARVTYEPAGSDWRLSLWGRNLTDEWYVNGGFDARNVWGTDFATIGRPREMGVTLQFFFD